MKSTREPSANFPLRGALDSAVSDELPALSGMLMVYYAVIAIGHWYLLPPNVAIFMVPLAGLTAMVLLVLLLAQWRLAIPSRFAQPLAFAVGSIALVNCVAYLYFSGGPRDSTNFALLIAASGWLVLSRTWLAAMTAMIWSSWSYIAFVVHPTKDWSHFAFFLLGATAFAVIVQSARRRMTGRVYRAESDLHRSIEHLQCSLKEKEVLVKEIHHRVKNNLQLVSSLLQLQSLHSTDRTIAEMFRECQSRVRSMALVHERLYRSGDLIEVEFTDYIEGVVDLLFQAYNVDRSRVQLTIEVEDIRLGIDAAIPCGLIINELVSNCLKHAFPGREGGRIRIELVAIMENDIQLRVEDDGIGLSLGIDPQKAETFGMHVISALVDQLHGHLEVTRSCGTGYRIIFPKCALKTDSARPPNRGEQRLSHDGMPVMVQGG